MVLPVIITLVLLWMVFADRERLCDGWSSRRWLAAKAVIVQVRDDVHLLDYVSEHSGSGVSRAESRTYRYRYEVDGTEHKSTRYSFEAYERSLMPSYEEGQEITIYYDPANHQRAVIKRGLTMVSLWVPGLALAACLWLLLVIIN